MSDISPLPSDEQAEQALLSCWLQEPELMDSLADDGFELSWFYVPANQLIAKCLWARRERGDPVDLVSITGALRDAKVPNSSISILDHCGGASYVTTLIDAAPTITIAGDMVSRLRDLALRRELKRMTRITDSLAGDSSKDVEEVISELVDGCERAVQAKGSPEKKKDKKNVLLRTMKWVQRQRDPSKANIIPSPWLKYNDRVGGFFPGELVYVAARPSIGKSALAMQILDENVRNGIKTDFFSLEMTEEQLCGRLIALRSGMPFSVMRKGGGSQIQLTQMMSSVDGIMKEGDFNLEDDVRNLELMTRKIRKSMETGTRMVIVDYIQLMETNKKFDGEVARMIHISSTLKKLANDLNIVIMPLAQLNRDQAKTGARESGPRRPMMSDIRSAGEQDADVIIMPHRPSKLDTGEGLEIEDDAELIIEKARNAPTFIIPMQFRGATMSFHETKF